MVDLIPQEYRRSLRLRCWLRRFCLAAAGVALLVGTAGAGLAHLVRNERSALASFRQIDAATGAHRSRIADLSARKDVAERQVKVLESLRGRAVIGELFYAIDAAMTGKIWFDEFSFAREGELTEVKPEARESGYFILIPQDKPAGAPVQGASPNAAGERAWRTQQRAEIRGHALDHSMLAEFIHRLGSQPGIGQVRLVDTSARNFSTAQVIDFQVVAVLGAPQGAPR